MNTTKLSNIAIVVLALCTLASTGILIRHEFFAPKIVVRDARPERIKGWREFAETGLRLGPPNAPVTITAFSDFQCPFCKQLNGVLDTLRREYPSEIAVVFRHYPLENIHAYAHQAALAAECANAQGRFAEFGDSVFAHQEALAQASWTHLAATAGVADTVTFRRCLLDSTFAGHIQRDVAAGKRLSVTGTPTVLVDGWRLRGPNSHHAIDSLIQLETKGRVASARR
jgi:protein-disulfide isomerase